MNEFVEKLKAGKKAMTERCREVATKLAEEAGVVTINENRRTLTGRANTKDRRISVPPPTTRRRLYIFAHECGHVLLGHDGRKTRHREEYEAERWVARRLAAVRDTRITQVHRGSQGLCSPKDFSGVSSRCKAY